MHGPFQLEHLIGKHKLNSVDAALETGLNRDTVIKLFQGDGAQG